MINGTKIKIPKGLQKRVRELYHDSDGYWLYTNRGYCTYEYGCHTIHEDTQKDVLQQLKFTDTCDCDYCKGLED